MTPAQTRDAIVADIRGASQQAEHGKDYWMGPNTLRALANRIAALPVGDGEPVAWRWHYGDGHIGPWHEMTKFHKPAKEIEYAYTAPPPAAFIVDPQAGTVTPAPAASCPYVRSGDEGTHYCTLSGPAAVPGVDALAQFIRRVDGSHQHGAATLAELICEWLAARPDAPAGEKGA